MTQLDVDPYLLAFLLLAPLFVLAERRAEDPVLNLGYFTDFAVGVTLLLSMLSGVILMGVIFVPQFAENALRIPAGQGGYFVIILGLFSGIGAPLSGTLTDKFGPKLVLGSPLNYMMLDRTPAAESYSALATLSLVRAIGTTLAPAVLIGFLAHAGAGLQDSLTAQLPKQLSAPTLPYATELQDKFAKMKDDPNLKDQLDGVEFPDLGGQTINIDVDGGGTRPDDLVELLKTADVTNITERTKIVADRMFSEKTPSVIADITDGVDTGLDSLDQAGTDLEKAHKKLTKAVDGIKKGISGMEKARSGMTKGINGMTKGIDRMTSGLRKLDSELADLRKAGAGVQAGLDQMLAALPPGFRGIYLATLITGVLATVLLVLYPSRRKDESGDEADAGAEGSPEPATP